MSAESEKAKLCLKFPDNWKRTVETVPGPFGTSENHIWAQSPDGKLEFDVAEGEMPLDSTAPDQALTNYVDMVGFDNDDPEDYNPIREWTFNNRKAYGFEAWTDDNTRIRVMCQEHHRGRLAVIGIQAASDLDMDKAVAELEKSLRFFA